MVSKELYHCSEAERLVEVLGKAPRIVGLMEAARRLPENEQMVMALSEEVVSFAGNYDALDKVSSEDKLDTLLAFASGRDMETIVAELGHTGQDKDMGMPGMARDGGMVGKEHMAYGPVCHYVHCVEERSAAPAKEVDGESSWPGPNAVAQDTDSLLMQTQLLTSAAFASFRSIRCSSNL